MQYVKQILTFLDLFVYSCWGMTLTEVIPALFSSPATAFSTIDNIIKLLFSFAGFVYLILRIWDYHHNSRLNRKLKELDIEQKRNEAFYNKWNKEFLDK